jgi:hypothetical protein
MGFSGAGGGPNVIADMVNRAISNDIDAQKANITSKREGLRDQAQALQNIYQGYRERGQDELSAYKMAQATLLDKTAMQVDALTAKTNGETAKANGEILSANLRAKKDETMESLRIHSMSATAAMMTARAHLASTGQKQGPTLGDAVEKRIAMGFDALKALSRARELHKKTDKAAVLGEAHMPWSSNNRTYKEATNAVVEGYGGFMSNGVLRNDDRIVYTAEVPGPVTSHAAAKVYFDSRNQAVLDKLQSEVDAQRAGGESTERTQAKLDELKKQYSPMRPGEE